jgi:hypothetical protein
MKALVRWLVESDATLFGNSVPPIEGGLSANREFGSGSDAWGGEFQVSRFARVCVGTPL